MTALPARTFGLAERGLIKPGYYADLVLFDPATVTDSATFDDPEQPARGIDRVFISGRVAWAGGTGGDRAGVFVTH